MDFPILQTGIIYMDSAATSLTPQPVLEKMMEFYQHIDQTSTVEYIIFHSGLAANMIWLAESWQNLSMPEPMKR